jgi:hypothetical protein
MRHERPESNGFRECDIGIRATSVTVPAPLPLVVRDRSSHDLDMLVWVVVKGHGSCPRDGAMA